MNRRKGGIGLLPLQDELEGPPDVRDLGRVQTALSVGGRIAGRHQHRVAIAERDVEHAREELDHVPDRAGAARLEEAEVAG